MKLKNRSEKAGIMNISAINNNYNYKAPTISVARNFKGAENANFRTLPFTRGEYKEYVLSLLQTNAQRQTVARAVDSLFKLTKERAVTKYLHNAVKRNKEGEEVETDLQNDLDKIHKGIRRQKEIMFAFCPQKKQEEFYQLTEKIIADYEVELAIGIMEIERREKIFNIGV